MRFFKVGSYCQRRVTDKEDIQMMSDKLLVD